MTLLPNVWGVELTREALASAVGEGVIGPAPSHVIGHLDDPPFVECVLVAAHYLTRLPKALQNVLHGSVTERDLILNQESAVDSFRRERDPVPVHKSQDGFFPLLGGHGRRFRDTLCSSIETVRTVFTNTFHRFQCVSFVSKRKKLSGRGTVVAMYDDCRVPNSGAGSPERAWRRPPGGGHAATMTDSTYTAPGLQARDRPTNRRTIDWEAVRSEVGE